MKIKFDPDNSEVAIADGEVKDFVNKILEKGEDVVISNEAVIDELRIIALGVFKDRRIFDVVIVMPGNIEVVIDLDGRLRLVDENTPEKPYITPNSERMCRLLELVRSARGKLHHRIKDTWERNGEELIH